MKACPYRKEFYKKIGGDDYNVVKDKMNTWLSGLEKNVKILQEFYTKGKHEF